MEVRSTTTLALLFIALSVHGPRCTRLERKTRAPLEGDCRLLGSSMGLRAAMPPGLLSGCRWRVVDGRFDEVRWQWVALEVAVVEGRRRRSRRLRLRGSHVIMSNVRVGSLLVVREERMAHLVPTAAGIAQVGTHVAQHPGAEDAARRNHGEQQEPEEQVFHDRPAVNARLHIYPICFSDISLLHET